MHNTSNGVIFNKARNATWCQKIKVSNRQTKAEIIHIQKMSNKQSKQVK